MDAESRKTFVASQSGCRYLFGSINFDPRAAGNGENKLRF
jgi:hypothetical protein